MTLSRAAWVVPVSAPPLRGGRVETGAGRVVAVGPDGPSVTRGRARGGPDRDLAGAIVMPGLVNAHTHLELSHLGGAAGPATDFVTWVRSLLTARRRFADPRDPVIVAGVREAIAQAARCGTAVVGDISNTLVTADLLAGSPLDGLVFHELIGFSAADPDRMAEDSAGSRQAPAGGRVRASLAAHAPYSVSPGLFQSIRRAVDQTRQPYSVHLAESPEEVQFTRTGQGPWRAFLEEIGVWNAEWTPPACGPVEYVSRLGFLSSRMLAVHAVQASDADLARLAQSGATVVTCPRSNVHVGVGAPPLERFYASAVRVAVGTDSLASAPDLNVFAELTAMRAMAPAVSAARLLESATSAGAAALGFDDDYGSIAPGKRDRLLVVTGAPPLAREADVEEYLVSGVEPRQLRWLDEID